MIRTVAASVLLTISIATAVPAYSAAYMKFDGVKGESTRNSPPNKDVKSNQTPKSTGMSIPAIQKAREAANTEGKKKGNVEYEWKVEAGEK